MSLEPVSFKKGRAHLSRLSAPYVPSRRNPRFWTDSEIIIVRRYYPTGGAAACLAHLPSHRTKSGVYIQAGKLGLTAKVGGGPKVRIETPSDFDEKLKDAWSLLDGKKHGTVNALAERLGVPRWWDTQRARKLGLTQPHKKKPPWTAAEDTLMAKVPLHNPAQGPQSRATCPGTLHRSGRLISWP